MFCSAKEYRQGLFMCNAILAVFVALILMSGNHNVSATMTRLPNRLKPTAEDFAICELSAEQKEKFLDNHNKYRGMVDPPAADMEYLFWDEDIANLAQMWSNQCVWEHGFVEFGDEYPHAVNFKRVGQNLARQWGTLDNPDDRVKAWYEERQYYSHSKFTIPMGASCSKEPCGHYTQVVWAKTKYLGCGVKWCDMDFDIPHPWIPGETIVTCNYGPTGNIIGEYPYKRGTPCTKCASGKGFCYKNLCRNCDNFDSECGKSFTQEMCSTRRELMAKKCPKMCNLCECPLKCQNGGTVNLQNCVCLCPSGWKGLDCSDKECPPGYYGENCEMRCYDVAGKSTCEWRVSHGHDCQAFYMRVDCAATCGYCDDGSKTPTTTAAPVTNVPPSPPTAIATTSSPLTTANPNIPTPTPQECKTNKHSRCEVWAANGECEKNPLWMIPNCCVSCKYHQMPKDCKDASPNCPVWAYTGECEINPLWMLKNCRQSCNQCGACKDTDAKCPSWALLKLCKSRDNMTWMNKNCRKSCGLCKVYDKHEECPAWAAMDECKTSNWTWMMDNCPRSCDVPRSETSFCGNKTNGNYQAPTTCQGYIACSNGVTRHVACPAGQKFDTVTKICQSANQATCTAVCPRSQIRLRGNLNTELCKKRGMRRSRICLKVSTLKKKQLQQHQQH